MHHHAFVIDIPEETLSDLQRPAGQHPLAGRNRQ